MLKVLWAVKTRIQFKNSLHLALSSKIAKQSKTKPKKMQTHLLVVSMCLLLPAATHLHDHITMLCATRTFQK